MSNEIVRVVHSLKDVVRNEMQLLLRQAHLNRDVIIGLIGDRGDGKTIGGTIIAICDYMVWDEPCFSNVGINIHFNIDEQLASEYNVKPGTVSFHSQPLDMVKFLRFDPEYRRGVFFIDEINVAVADARRSMSNQNIEATDVGQQLRKLESALIYTSIHEMFVEWRIRDMTDIFISTRDTALSPEGLAMKKPPGLEFEWTIYPMSRKLTGERYQDSKQTMKGTIYGRRWWGAVDTLQRQDRRKYSVPIGSGTLEDAEIDIGESPAVMAAKSRWGWLYEDIKNLHDQGYEEISNWDLWDYLRINERGISRSEVGKQLALMGIRANKRDGSGRYYYPIDSFDLKRGILDDKKEAVLLRGSAGEAPS